MNVRTLGDESSLPSSKINNNSSNGSMSLTSSMFSSKMIPFVTISTIAMCVGLHVALIAYDNEENNTRA